MSAMHSEYDVVIVGGAFSGAASAILLLQADPSLRVLIIEKTEAFDRKVGESTVELSSWFITRMLKLHRHLIFQQLPKHGLRFWFHNDKVQTLGDASELGSLYQARVASYHVDRAVLDQQVLSRAVEAGAELIRPAKVVGVDLMDTAPATVQIEDASGRCEIRARWVVDATGRTTWLARKLGLLSAVPEHPINSIWARYRGVNDFDSTWLPQMGPGLDAVNCARGMSTNHLTGLGWWVWVIPLPGGDMSVGVVWDERLFDLPPGENVGDRFEKFLRSTPVGREMMQNATRMDGDLHQLNALPYRVSRLMGDGWAIVGDAAGFIDPFYSMGLDWAALSITMSTEIIRRSLAGQSCGPAIEHHNARFAQGFDRWLRGIYIDKYYYMGDSELLEIAVRLEVPMYYFGVVTPPYMKGPAGLDLPFSPVAGTPFFHMMKFVNARLVGLAKTRLAAGTWGRRNAGRRVLLSGFKLGPSTFFWLPGALARLLALEIGSIPDRIKARRNMKNLHLKGESPGKTATHSIESPHHTSVK